MIVDGVVADETVRILHAGNTTFITVDDIDRFRSRIYFLEHKSRFCRTYYENDRPCGKWLPVTSDTHPQIIVGCTGYMCSVCGRIEEDNGEPFCHCGARMYNEEDEAEEDD